jgi:SP family sugar:H+ symporter-like MFS transporter
LANIFRNFLLAFFTPFITGAIDFRYGYVFAGTNILGGLIVYFFVIEGQGRTLEEIDTMYLMGVKPWDSAKYVVPSLEEMDAKTRERLEAANPELAIQREAGVDAGAGAGADAGGLKAAEASDGSEATMAEKREENGV